LLLVFFRRRAVSGFHFQFAAGEVRVKRREKRDRFAGETKVVGIEFDTEGVVAHGLRGGNGGAGTREGIEEHALTQGQSGAEEDAHEVLRFDSRVISDGFLAVGRASAGDDIGKCSHCLDGRNGLPAP